MRSAKDCNMELSSCYDSCYPPQLFKPALVTYRECTVRPAAATVGRNVLIKRFGKVVLAVNVAPVKVLWHLFVPV
jgi:hypothetical protein